MRAEPCTYRVTIDVGGRTLVTTLTVREDPGVDR
jgi:hypothetical protein